MILEPSIILNELIFKPLKKIWLIACCLFSLLSFSNGCLLSQQSKVSIITCSPGSELFSAFGHSAIRIQDSENDIDWIYNFGTFDFEDPNFYLKFVKGSQNYYLSKDDFYDFAYFYYVSQRRVVQQELNLSQSQNQLVYDALEENLMPENCSFHYDFFYRNCATKIADLFEQLFEHDFVFKDYRDEECKTIRGLIKLYTADNPWGELGIDLALGSKIDRVAFPREYAFLPDYLSLFFNNAAIYKNNSLQRLVSSSYTIVRARKIETQKRLFTPNFFFEVLAVLILSITLIDILRKKRTTILDFLWHFTTGILGVVLIFLWFFSSHHAAANNLNILWLFPLNLFFAFLLLSKKYRVFKVYYAGFQILLFVLLAIFWFAAPLQEFNLAILPLLIAMTFRCFILLFFHAFFRLPFVNLKN